MKFDSTAPPSAAGSTMVLFIGVDNKDNLSWRGVDQAGLVLNPPLKVLISLGKEVILSLSLNEPLTHASKGLSHDELLWTIWGSRGDETKTICLYCQTNDEEEVNQDYYNDARNLESGKGDPNSICNGNLDTLC
jgi:hypothetical protein